MKAYEELMPKHHEKRQLPYSAQQMYQLVAHIETYSDFLPWCKQSHVRSRQTIEDGQIILADLTIAFALFHERFGSKVTLHDDCFKIQVEYLDGPFHYLVNEWHFSDNEAGCFTEFFVDFEFKSKVLQKIIGVVFYDAMQKIMGAFEQRAKRLYGVPLLSVKE